MYYDPGMTRSRISVLALLLAACGGEEGALCGEGLEPVIVTGLNGTIEGAPAVEVLYRVPDTCAVVDRTWMFWDDPTETITFGDEPTSGTLMRDEVDVGDDDRRIFFRDVGVGVRLEYPGEDVAPEVDFVWFAAATELTRAPCAGDGTTLRCGAP